MQPNIATAPLDCPGCGAIRWRLVGPIILGVPVEVAGVRCDDQSFHASLFECEGCGLLLKWPRLSEETLAACYGCADASFGGWAVDVSRRNFHLCQELLERYAKGRKILDIGCFHGSFERFLGPTWERFGVEPSQSASAEAQAAGIQILGRAIEDIPIGQTFDCITAMDVVEHLPNVGEFFQRVQDLLNPGGIFLVETGDTGSLPWRLFGARYWYAALPEHIVFLNLKCCMALAARSKLNLVEFRRVAHLRAVVRHWINDWFKNVVYWLITRLGATQLNYLDNKFWRRKSPGWLSARDHMIAVFQRP